MPFAILAVWSVGLQTPPRPNVLLNLAPPRSRFERLAPLPGVASVMIDTQQSQWGLAQQAARARRLQGRMLWVDCTANIERYNTPEKIKDVVAKAADAGFNTLVFDIKPISGQVVYPTALAPKLTEWINRKLPADFDPIPHFVRECKEAGLSLLVSLNAFSEGHRNFRVGPGYDRVDLQTVLYEADPFVRNNGASFPLAPNPNELPEAGDKIGVFTDAAKIPAHTEGMFAVTLDRFGKVLDGFEEAGVGPGVPTIPRIGSALVGRGPGAEFLRANVTPGATLYFDSRPQFVPISARPEQQIPLMMNPHHTEVINRTIAIAKEVIAKYQVDGLLYDDRMRYGGVNADFSPEARAGFERWVGKKLNWPDDVFKFIYTPALVRGMRPGPYYDAWLSWRALTLRNFIARVRQEIKSVRENALFGIYAGSWYGEYPSFGANYASSETDAGFWFLTPNYQKTGFAGHLDLFVSGCYYPTSTIYEAMENGTPIGTTVEASGAMSNRLIRDRAWTYAGIALSQFRDNPRGLQNALQAACAVSQGVMVFDLSHNIDPMWPVFKQAFSMKLRPPHLYPDVLTDVRKKRVASEMRGTKERAVPILAGAAGAGQ